MGTLKRWLPTGMLLAATEKVRNEANFAETQS
jgi:hypothetical protein